MCCYIWHAGNSCEIVSQDTFEFDQGHMTKNQPTTVLVLSSENLHVYCCLTISTN